MGKAVTLGLEKTEAGLGVSRGSRGGMWWKIHQSSAGDPMRWLERKADRCV
jgi:hypothetical protein